MNKRRSRIGLLDQKAEEYTETLPAFLRSFLDRCQEERIPKGLAETAAQMAVESLLHDSEETADDGLIED